MNICAQSLCGHVFSFPFYKYQGIEDFIHMASVNFYKIYQFIFQNSCTILYSHQQCKRVSVVLHSHQLLMWTLFFIFALLAVYSHCHISSSFTFF